MRLSSDNIIIWIILYLLYTCNDLVLKGIFICLLSIRGYSVIIRYILKTFGVRYQKIPLKYITRFFEWQIDTATTYNGGWQIEGSPHLIKYKYFDRSNKRNICNSIGEI